VISNFYHRLFLVASTIWAIASASQVHAEDRARSDSDARYLHHIDLYDINNRKIRPDSTTPYSPLNTCGRCHDYETISHGWHFNAFQPDSRAGRPGEPWIWTDIRTGTQLPLSYRRDWNHVYDPNTVGLTPWEMALHFGARIPGGNMHPGESTGQGKVDSTPSSGDALDEKDDEAAKESLPSDPIGSVNSVADSPRWKFSGTLEIDCMVCHAVSGAYDFVERGLQIDQENFAWAPTAALRLGAVKGETSSIKDDADPDDEATQKKLPQVTYDPSRFHPDGKVFMDLVRKPSTNACYQCHSQRLVSEAGVEPRWTHDQDVHLRAGMDCVDCHRNGIDHHIVRGFAGERHPSEPDDPSDAPLETLSCQGCHLGANDADPADIAARPGRLGSPKPMHAGLPPVHFEKLSCTACHGGPIPRDQALQIMTSLAHGLGRKAHRTGAELPRIAAPVFLPGHDGRVGPHRAMWPAFWAELKDGKLQPLLPTQVYDATRPALRVRKDFVDEVLQPKLTSSELKELLGEDRAKKDESWTDEEQTKVDSATAQKGRQQFNEKIYAALAAIEKEMGIEQAVYVSSGLVYGKADAEDTLKQIQVDDPKATGMVTWPMAHHVRPAGWSLGTNGCVECHSDNGKIFASTVTTLGPGPDQGEPVTMAALQGVDPDQRLGWNELFKGRQTFKYVIGGSITILLMTLFIGVGALAAKII
jgi:hypothetical protein